MDDGSLGSAVNFVAKPFRSDEIKNDDFEVFESNLETDSFLYVSLNIET